MRLEECPIRAALDVISGKWKPVILYHLMKGKKRFSELQKLMPDTAQKILTQQLRELEQDGVVVRRVIPGGRPRVEYSFSAKGESLLPVLWELCKWAKANRLVTGT